MDEREKKSVTVYLISLVVILANLIIFCVIYQVPFLSGLPVVRKALPLISFLAVYPFDLFQIYFKEDFLIHGFWILSVSISSFGLLVLNKFARTVFIVFNIIHFVILGVISAFYFGQTMFWGYFFKCYFNGVAFLFYVGYLTLPEIYKQFETLNSEKHWTLWFLNRRQKILLPKDAQGYFHLALAYQRLGRVDEALDLLKRAAVIMPEKVDYHFAIAQIYFDRKDYSAAIKTLVDIVNLDPLHALARYLLARAYQKTGCLNEALEAFRRCSYLQPANDEVFCQIGIVSYHTGHLAEAQAALQKAIDLKSQNHLCPFYLGLILAKDPQQMKNAQEYFKKALRLKPDFIDGYRELGNLFVGLGDYKAAVGAFRDVLRLDENLTQVHYHLGFAYAMLKDMESARREYRYLKDTDPQLAQTLNLLLSNNGSI